MGNDLSVVRAARVSYDAAWRAGKDKGSDDRLIHYLWKNRHTTPFEAVTFTFEVKAPIFVFRQWHRHRTLYERAFIEVAKRTLPKDVFESLHEAATILFRQRRKERLAEQADTSA